MKPLVTHVRITDSCHSLVKKEKNSFLKIKELFIMNILHCIIFMHMHT